MAKARFLAQAPLREAIIDLRVILPKDVAADDLANLGSELVGRYPARNEKISLTGEFQLAGEKGIVSSTAGHTRLGYMFSSTDETQVVQFRMNGFTFSRLAPYTDWDHVFPEAMELWKRYLEIARPLKIVRIATRYVNDMRFSLPLELSDYLAAPPPQPPGIPDEVIGFLTQLAVLDAESGSKVNIVQTSREIKLEEVSIILDIDAFQDGLSTVRCSG